MPLRWTRLGQNHLTVCGRGRVYQYDTDFCCAWIRQNGYWVAAKGPSSRALHYKLLANAKAAVEKRLEREDATPAIAA